MGTDIDSYRLLESLGYKLSSAARTHERRIESQMAGLGLHRRDFTVLVAIGREGRSQPSEIADFLNVERPVVSRSLKVLEAAGLLVVGQANSDRRVRVVGLSPRGLQAMNAGIAVVMQANDLIRSVLSEAERDALAMMLDRIRIARATRQSSI